MARITRRDNKRFVSDGFYHFAPDRRSAAATRVDSSPVLVAKVDSKTALRLATRPSSPGPQPWTRRLRFCATQRPGGPGAESSAAGLRSRRNACGPELPPVTVQLKVCRTQENGNDAATQACQCAPVAETATMTPGRPGGSSSLRLMLARRQGRVVPVMVQSHRLGGGGT